MVEQLFCLDCVTLGDTNPSRTKQKQVPSCYLACMSTEALLNRQRWWGADHPDHPFGALCEPAEPAVCDRHGCQRDHPAGGHPIPHACALLQPALRRRNAAQFPELPLVSPGVVLQPSDCSSLSLSCLGSVWGVSVPLVTNGRLTCTSQIYGSCSHVCCGACSILLCLVAVALRPVCTCVIHDALHVT